MNKNNKGESLNDFNEPQVNLGVKTPKDFVEGVQYEKDRTHDRWRKTLVTLALVVLVAAMNWFVIDIVQDILQSDSDLLAKKLINAEGRIVTTEVLLALIGGTVAQVSALLVIAVKSIFSKN